MFDLIPSRLSRRTQYARPSSTLFFCLVGAFLLTLLPHLPQLPSWISITVLVAMIIRSIIEVRRWPLPSSAFCGVLALAVLGAVYLHYDTIFGRDAGTAFMSALLAIKFFEMRGPRDVALIIFCSFFLVMSSLLYSQAIELFVYCLIMMWVLTAILLRTSMGDLPDNRLLLMLRTSAVIFFQALPLTLFLFFFFPRYHGVLALGVGQSSIGLTDRVAPGSISRLADDQSTAMTVRFSGRVFPTTDTLYWRAIVLWTYENGVWFPGPGDSAPSNRLEALPKAAPDTSLVGQEITIFPHFHRWLFALDYPVARAIPVDLTDGWSEGLDGGTLRLSDPTTTVSHKMRYTVVSASQLAPQDLDPESRRAALALPHEKEDHIDPGVKALAVELAQGCVTEDDYIRSILHFFRHHFIYSDTPGRREKDALAGFLLRSKTGFCEDFASAFAVLMRLDGFPTRMIAGYQGAQYNPYNDIYIVKQSDAHAWDEVWIESEKHWRRVDPTAILSTNATTAGTLIQSPSQGDATDQNLSIGFANHRLNLGSADELPSWMRQGLLDIQFRREEMEEDWDDWVFSYDPDTQNRLAQALGLGAKVRTFLGLVCLATVALFGLVFALTILRRAPVSPIEKFYVRFCRSMAQRGAPRAIWEGPLAYTDRLAELFPEKREVFAEAGRIVADARYGSVSPPVNRADLRSLLLLLTASQASQASRTSQVAHGESSSRERP